METWRLLDTGPTDGPTNMAIDEAIMLSYADGRVPPTLRLYSWRPVCLSIGFFQSVHREIDLAECRRRDIDIVRRPTGGRAILHASELTYSVVTGRHSAFASPGVSQSYHGISQALAAGLRSLGADVQIAPRIERARRARLTAADDAPRSHRTPACFDLPSDHEITVHGRKLVGSAQLRRHGVILQHGSILLDVDLSALVAVLRLSPALAPDLLVPILAKKMIGLREALARDVTYLEVADSIARGFKRAAPLALTPAPLTPDEHTLATHLRSDKYAAAPWTFRR